MIDRVGALETIDGIVERGGDADEVLRSVLEVLHERGIPFGEIHFVEEGRLVAGPSIGERREARTTPVVYRGDRVGTLELADTDATFADRVATLISPYVLVGWDTAGEPWSP
jgi:ethanolamine ammonia-lyase small subunit